jgi:hypothetical protein
MGLRDTKGTYVLTTNHHMQGILLLIIMEIALRAEELPVLLTNFWTPTWN